MLEASTPLSKKDKILKLRFPISWILSCITMFGLFYVWHGVLLNDISHITYPKNIFFLSALLVYIIIAFVLNLLFMSKIATDYIEGIITRGFVCGIALGIIIFLITMVVGVSFSTQLNLRNILFDFSWQCAEQGVAGIIVGSVYAYFKYSLRLERN
ncbi:MAG: hypothetical protein J0M08_07780 [Bacteroidetes bacterium]|nr:hypothetical protein [Bacteroidota bacterium]